MIYIYFLILSHFIYTFFYITLFVFSKKLGYTNNEVPKCKHFVSHPVNVFALTQKQLHC